MPGGAQRGPAFRKQKGSSLTAEVGAVAPQGATGGIRRLASAECPAIPPLITYSSYSSRFTLHGRMVPLGRLLQGCMSKSGYVSWTALDALCGAFSGPPGRLVPVDLPGKGSAAYAVHGVALRHSLIIARV